MPTYVLTDPLYVAIPWRPQNQHIQNRCSILQPAQSFSPASVYHLHPPSCQVNSFKLQFFSIPSSDSQSCLLYHPEVSSKLPLTITVGTAGGQTSSYAINIENSCYLNFMYLEHIHNLYPSG